MLEEDKKKMIRKMELELNIAKAEISIEEKKEDKIKVEQNLKDRLRALDNEILTIQDSISKQKLELEKLL